MVPAFKQQLTTMAFEMPDKIGALQAARRLRAWHDSSISKEQVMKLELTAVFKKVPEGYIGFVEELPGANTQGATLEEVRANLREAALMVLEANRTLAEEELGGAEVIREPLKIDRPRGNTQEVVTSYGKTWK